jgi:hypothetical protein
LINRLVALKEPFRRQKLLDFCNPLDFNVNFLGTSTGLGFSADTATCSGLGTPLTSPDAYINCGNKQVTGLHVALLGLLSPRTRELLEDNGWCSVVPEGSSTTVCNSWLPARASSLGDPPVAPVNRLRLCQRRLFLGGRSLFSQELDYIEPSSEDFLACEVRRAWGDIDNATYQSCVAAASSAATGRRAGRDDKRPGVLNKMHLGCDELPFEDVTGPLGFSDLVASCGASSSGELIDCIAARARCLAWRVINYVQPRVQLDVPASFLDDYAACGS